MRILQLSYERTPKRLAPAGGDLGMYQNLCAMVELGHEVHLAVIGARERVDPEVRALVASVDEIAPKPTPFALRPLQRFLNPETFALRFPAASGYLAAITDLVSRYKPELVWADSSFALGLAPRAQLPVVFGNYDFLFKLKAVRRATASQGRLRDVRDLRALRRRIRRPDALSARALEAFELRLAAEAAHVMCVSSSEADFLRGKGIASTHIPIVGPTIARSAAASGAQPARFFLFGNHNTAHAAALSEIRHHLWPALERAGVRAEWHQIGRAPQHPDDDWKWMERSFAKVHGFVDDLGAVFRQGDLSIVPYRHDTGFRTKFTVAAAYGVASAGYEETFFCAPEFSRSIDCISERDAEGLATALGRAAKDPGWRESLGAAARTLYESTYTFEAQLPRYQQILRTALDARPVRTTVEG